ncbi:MAG: hypothetical protein ACO3JL_01460 [Myxococcota bacterium]
MVLGYKILHLAGIGALMLSLGALSMHAMNGGTRESLRTRPLVFATHGLALLLLLVSGFGMMARLQLSYGGVWVWAKVGLWLLLGGAVALPLRVPASGRFLWPLAPVLVGIAAALALYKPGA